MIAGEGRAYACALGWLNPAEADGLLRTARCAAGPGRRRWLRHNDAAGSAARIERLVLLTEPADLDAGEITDKGYVNQREVLASGPDLVELALHRPAIGGRHRGRGRAKCYGVLTKILEDVEHGMTDPRRGRS